MTKTQKVWNMTILFQSCSLKYPNKAFSTQKLFLFVLHNFFVFQEISLCWFQISQTFFPILSLKIPKRRFLISNLRIFIFAWNFFELSTQSYTNLSSKSETFCDARLAFSQVWGYWFQVSKTFVLLKILLNDIFRGAEYTWICVKHYVSK